MFRKVFVSLWSCGVGWTGYVAVMECSRVQELRPSSSTSGGQSLGGATAAWGVAGAGLPFIMADQDLNAAPEEQERHLYEEA